MSNWGWMFVLLGVIKITALVIHSRMLMVTVLSIALGTYIMWTLSFLVSISQTESASITVPWFWTMVVMAHVASLQSITKDK